jgi:hypothetical protein
MQLWEYAILTQRKVFEHLIPGDNTSDWAAPSITVTFDAGDHVDKKIPEHSRIIDILNYVGLDGWEVFEMDSEKAVYKSEVFTSGSSDWITRRYWLKRPRRLEDA